MPKNVPFLKKNQVDVVFVSSLKHNKKKMTILFFVYFGTHNNKIHTIYKQTSVFVVIFSMLMVLLLLAKQHQQMTT
jgi:hypothetical protein